MTSLAERNSNTQNETSKLKEKMQNEWWQEKGEVEKESMDGRRKGKGRQGEAAAISAFKELTV